MAEQNGQHMIQSLRHKWQRSYLSGAILIALAASVLLETILYLSWEIPWWSALILFFVSAALVYWLRPFRRISDDDIARYLNCHYPQLEESSQLLLIPEDSVSLLQQMQRRKMEAVISTIPAPLDMQKPLKRSGLVLLITCLICVAGISAQTLLSKSSTDKTPPTPITAQPEIIPPGIRDFTVTITPPSYTRQSRRSQEQFTLKVEEGSLVLWTIRTKGDVDSVNLVFNNKDKIALKRLPSDNNQWTTERIIKEPGFYQLELAGNASTLYTMEVIHDQPADIRILSPQQYTTIDPGTKPISTLRVHISDDYGITHAQIITTKASGKGESVSFKEEKLNFPVQFSGQKSIETSRILDLAAMGLQGGDELYFYVKATDNHGQESRSDMYFISLPDTAELLSLSGMESGVDQFPEYFRSQRQIIIDTEKLLKEQASVGKDTFNARSNNLGIEQKLLRLRYGKFLGEEDESGGGHSPDDGHDHGTEPEYGDVQSLIDQYAHKHDNAEDATFLEPEQKAQLKAVLTEMWNSELKLRTLAPAESLPYQYKALRLLKDLQQKSRAYVSKTSIKMPPLKPEKRLNGNLEKVNPHIEPAKQVKEDLQIQQLRSAMHLLEMLKQKQNLSAEDQASLVTAEKAISERAIRQPAKYLPALSALRTISSSQSSADKAEILLVQNALQDIIPTTTELPKRINSREGKLSDLYFKKLAAKP